MTSLQQSRWAGVSPKPLAQSASAVRRGWLQAISRRIRWHVNHRIRFLLPLLSRWRLKVTVVNGFGSPGDVLLTAMFVRNLKRHFPGLRINLVTANPELVLHDPSVESINGRETYFSIRFWYLDVLENKKAYTNVLAATCRLAGVHPFNYRAAVFLTDEEIRQAKIRAAIHSRPIITINVMSRELVKVWPLNHWQVLVDELRSHYSVVQLGAADEPFFSGVQRLAGQLSFRESMAFLSQSVLHIGPDSFLMHAANGVGTPSVIIFGGSRTPANVGYQENINLFRAIPCGPCYIHTSRGQHCEHDMKCMKEISPDDVLTAVRGKLAAAAGQQRSQFTFPFCANT